MSCRSLTNRHCSNAFSTRSQEADEAAPRPQTRLSGKPLWIAVAAFYLLSCQSIATTQDPPPQSPPNPQFAAQPPAPPRPLFPLWRELLTAPVPFDHYNLKGVHAFRQWEDAIKHESNTLDTLLRLPRPRNLDLQMYDFHLRSSVVGISARRFSHSRSAMYLYVMPHNLTVYSLRGITEAGEQHEPLFSWETAEVLVEMGQMAPHPALFKRLESEVPRDPDLRLIAFILHKIDGPRIGLVRIEEEIRLLDSEPTRVPRHSRPTKLANLQVLKDWFSTPGFFADRANFPTPPGKTPGFLKALEQAQVEVELLRRTGGFDDGSPPKPKP